MNLKRLFVAMMLPLFAFVMQANAQDKTVTGKVTDATGAAVAGVTIKVKGGKALGSTKTDGTFLVKAANNAMLEFSSIGFTTIAMQVPPSGEMTVSIKAGNDNLNEVVVIGYGTAKKKDLTGAVATVSSKDFVKGALTTPEQMISGKVAGVSVVANDGQPGSGSVIRIRGGSSINASNDPLIVIDGVPVDGGVSGSPNPLSLINPNDVETFTVLKDASAAAIYGSRASNGVIIITTKRGKSGKPTFNFSSVMSVYTPAKYLDVLSAQQFRDYVKANGTAAEIAKLGTANTDWQKEIYKTSVGYDNNLSISGATKKIPYRASLGYLNQQGILDGGFLKRTTASLNVSPKFFKDHLKVDLNLKGAVTNSKFANSGAVGEAASYDPTQPIYSNSKRFNGYREWVNLAGGSTVDNAPPFGGSNPVGLLKQTDDRSHVERSIGNIQFDYKLHFLPDLRVNLNLGYDVQTGRGSTIVNDSAASDYKNYTDPISGKLKGGKNDIYRQSKTNKLMDLYLNYVKETNIGRFDFTTGYSYQNFQTKDFFYVGRTFDSTQRGKDLNFTYNIPEYTLIGYYARLNYSYKSKYLFTASIRRDGSSRFAPESRWGTFPSAAAAWRIKEESFLKNVKSINELKLRLGYGATGQQDGIGLYDHLARYSLTDGQSTYQFGNSFFNGYTPGAYYPRKWEETRMINAAIDFGFSNNKISGTIEYYNRKTIDLLNSTNLPAGSNFSNEFVANVASMKNEGVELTLNASVMRKKDMTLDFSFNANYNQNTITKLRLNDDPSYAGNQYGGVGFGGNTVQINSIGYTRGTFYVFKQVYDPKTGKPIEGLVEDINRDGNVNKEKDLYRYKQVDPIMFMGFTTNFTYKKFSAGFVLRGSYGNYIYNARNARLGNLTNVIQSYGSGYLSNAPTDILNTNFRDVKDQSRLSDYYVENAAFIRMDNINVGYNIGKVFKNAANLRLGANVQNAFVITKYTGLDPEVFGGIDNTSYARPRVFVLSMNLDF